MNHKTFSLPFAMKLCLLAFLAELAKQGCTYSLVFHRSMINWAFGVLFNVFFYSTCVQTVSHFEKRGDCLPSSDFYMDLC